MTEQTHLNTFVRLADVKAALASLTTTTGIDALPRFILHEGHETNEAGIAELRDTCGRNVEPNGRLWTNGG